MRQFIEVPASVKAELARAFDVNERTVRNALDYSGQSDLCRRIRCFAMQKGGVVMTVQPLMETIHTSCGVMRQTFPNGAEIEVDMHSGRLELRHKGVVRQRVDAGCTIPELYVLQEQAASL